LHIWDFEVATWESTLWKMPLGKYLISFISQFIPGDNIKLMRGRYYSICQTKYSSKTENKDKKLISYPFSFKFYYIN